MKDPTLWNGRLVAIRGIVENALRPESDCDRPFVTQTHTWPSAIDIRDPDPEDDVIDKDWLAEGNWIAKAYTYGDYHFSATESKRRGATKIAATFIGRLVTREKYFLYPAGGSLGNGFGPLPIYPARLIVRAVRDMSVEWPKPQQYRPGGKNEPKRDNVGWH